MSELPPAEQVQATYVRFPADLHARLKEYARAHDLTMAQVVRAAVREKIDTPEVPR